MNTLEEAGRLAERIRALLGPDVHVTDNALTIAPALADGTTVVAIQPPDLEFPAPIGTVEASWELYAIAGPYTDMRRAWASLDAVIHALAEPLYLAGAKTATYEHPGTPGYPAYVLTFSETY